MASITRRDGKWQARVRRRGFPEQSERFATKAAAERWAREIEGRIDDGTFAPSAREAGRVTLDEALERYANEITKKKRSHRPELLKIQAIRRHEIAQRMLGSLGSHDFASFRDDLEERDLAANTIRLYLAPLSHLYKIARTEWGMEGLRNPLEDVAKPSANGSARDRRLRDGELDKLQLAEGAPAWLPSIITLAVETAMRRGEMAALTDECIRGSVAHLKMTKNGDARSVPLSPDALAALEALRQLGGGTLQMPTPGAMTKAFAAAVKAARLKDLRLHDLRHEATSRLFEAGLSLPEVAAVTGHKTWAMLRRYTHPKAETIAAKLGAKRAAVE